MKFGGTSVQDAVCLRRAAGIVAAAEGPVVVVVSAVGDVTRRLLAAGQAAIDEPSRARRDIAEIGDLHHAVLDDLGGDHGNDTAVAAARATVVRLLGELAERVDRVAAGGDYTRRSQDAVISFGERLATALFVAATGGRARHVDARDLIVTDDRFRAARPDRALIAERVEARLMPLLVSGATVVTEGFIGATAAGETTTMGFEASDLTAALLGNAVRAREIQIWTDVPGMLTTGHPAVADPSVVRRLSFDEAAELALFGAKVLHPDTVAPARELDIPVRILPSRDPSAEGSRIAGGTVGPRGPKAVAAIEDLMSDPGRRLRATLGLDAPDAAWTGQGIVCLVGEGVGNDASVIPHVGRILADIPCSRLSVHRPDSVAVVLPTAAVGTGVERLHRELIVGARLAVADLPK